MSQHRGKKYLTPEQRTARIRHVFEAMNAHDFESIEASIRQDWAQRVKTWKEGLTPERQIRHAMQGSDAMLDAGLQEFIEETRDRFSRHQEKFWPEILEHAAGYPDDRLWDILEEYKQVKLEAKPEPFPSPAPQQHSDFIGDCGPSDLPPRCQPPSCATSWLPRPSPQPADRDLSPGHETIRQMLDDVEAVTTSRFYEDPDPIASPIEMFLVRDGEQGGEPFSDLSVREKVQVLWDYTPSYEERGISFEPMDQVFRNIVLEDKPREQWLEGTGLDGRPAAAPPTMPQIAERLRREIRERGEKADRPMSPSLPPQGRDWIEPAPTPTPAPPQKDRDMDRDR